MDGLLLGECLDTPRGARPRRIFKNARISMDLAAKRRPGVGWLGLAGVRPSGSRGRRILRFAEADTDFGFGRLNSALCL